MKYFTIKNVVILLCLILTVACNKDDAAVQEQVYFPKLMQFHAVSTTIDYYRTSTYSLNYNENNTIADIQILSNVPSGSYNSKVEIEYNGNNVSKIIATDITNNVIAESEFKYSNGVFAGFNYITGGAEYNIDLTFNDNENTYTTSADNPRIYSFDSENVFLGLSGLSIMDFALDFAMNRKAPFVEFIPSHELIIWFNEIDIGLAELYYFSPYFIENKDSDNNFSDVQYENFVTDSKGNLIKYSTNSSSEESTCDIVYELRNKTPGN